MNVAELVKIRCTACGAELVIRPASMRLEGVEKGITATEFLHPKPTCEKWKSNRRAWCLPEL